MNPPLFTRARGLGMDPAPHLASGLLEVHQVDPVEISPGEFIDRIQQLVEDGGAQLVVIDSINGFLNAMPNEQLLSLQLHELLAYLSHRGVATLFTLAQQGFIGNMQSPVDVSYLADTVLLFRYFEWSGEIHQALSVIKKRSGPHERTIRELFLKDGQVKVGPALKDFEGILTGVPSYVGEELEPGRRA